MLGRFASFALIVVTLALLASAPGSRAQSGADPIFQRLLSSPDDPALNRQFAREAEERGDLRHALAALARAREANPNDPDAAAEYERVRRKMLPAVTTGLAQVGQTYASNSRQLPSSSLRRREDGIVDASVLIEDERTLGDTRWRSRAMAFGQLDWSNNELSNGRMTVEAGPLFGLGGTSWLHLAPGTAAQWLDGRRLYNEASASATLGAVLGGMTQTVTGRYAWRRGNDDVFYSDSHVIDLEARLATSPSVLRGDLFYLQPRWRTVVAINPLPETVTLNGILVDTSFVPPQFKEQQSLEVARDLAPLTHNEWGARAAYLVPVNAGSFYVGAGISLFERDFASHVLAPIEKPFINPKAPRPISGIGLSSEKRRDLYIEPTAHLVFPRLLGPAMDLRIDYRFEDNHSNDRFREFQDHLISLRMLGRF